LLTTQRRVAARPRSVDRWRREREKVRSLVQGVKVGVIGIDHGHIVGMLANMLAAGCHCSHWWSEGEPLTAEAFRGQFPTLERTVDRRRILEDPEVAMVLISAIPADRARLAIEAMEAGKDVMVDKPGCTTLADLTAIEACVARTGRIWTVNFSERFEVRAVAKAEELVAAGAIGRVRQTLGTGPHRIGGPRPSWFWQREAFGGILCDIGSHQIDQFLHFTGSTGAEVSFARVENRSRPDAPGFQDFGEMVLTGDGGNGYVRVDWFTPAALPVWGDGRLFILGEEGTIELRKYLDLARDHAGNQLYLANGSTVERIDCNDVPLPYFGRLVNDIRDRSETAVPQSHTLLVMRLALQAQALAEATRVEGPHA
jgi:predicted dehydrogenase